MRTRPRQLAIAAVVALLAIIVAACDETTSSQRSQVVSLINKERAKTGASSLRQADDLNTKAGNWAAKMRNECRLSHSKLSDGVTLKWSQLGENVAYGPSIPKTHSSLMNSPRHRANNGQVLASLAVQGIGIVYAPDFIVANEIRAGQLVPLLPDYRPPRSPIAAVYPSRRHLSAKVRSFVEFLAGRYEQQHEWSLDDILGAHKLPGA